MDSKPTALPVSNRQQLIILAAISALYIGFGMTIGLIQGGIPTIMRAQGVSLASVGWLYALYLPFGVAFLWSPLIDRYALPWLTPRVSWIVPLQLTAALLVAAIACLPGASPGLLFLLGMVVALCMATMDIALDALAVELVASRWRPWAAAFKAGSLALGAIIGGGLFLSVFQLAGWQSLFSVFAVILLLLALPPLMLQVYEKNLSPSSRQGNQTASLLRLLASAKQRRRLLLLTLACCVIFPLSGLNRLMLVDLGIDLSTIGWVIGTLGPLSMLLVSIVSIPLMQRAGLSFALRSFAMLLLSALGAMAAGYLTEAAAMAITGAVLAGAAVSGMYVTLSASILGWSAGRQPATDYATFYGISRFASTLLTMLAAPLVAWLSWPLFYATGAVALMIIVALLRTPLSEKDHHHAA